MSATVVVWWIISAFVLDIAFAQEVETINGRIKGRTIAILGKRLDVFHGIPFAKPPIGHLRFKHPVPADPWRPEVKDATREAPSCIQSTRVYDMMPKGDSRSLVDDYSEDCLYLSVWKPTSAVTGSKLAVMVWIYGGGFAHGSTRIPVYNGQYLSSINDIIVVSVNYRVGPMGFSYLGRDTIPGNMGLLDQVEALKWVKNNIESFGGDKNKITLFGQSTGAFSVGYHLLSPLSRDLFNNGILQSGVPVNNVLNGMLSTKSEAVDCVSDLSKAMGCQGTSELEMFECLKNANAFKITDTWCSLEGLTFYPVVDGYFFPEEPRALLERGEHKQVNIMTGTTKDEVTLFFSLFMDPTNLTVTSTDEPFAQKHLAMAVNKVTGLQHKNVIKALQIFYESEQGPPIDYVKLLNHLGSDISLKCAALHYSSYYAQSSNVFIYSLNHPLSIMPHPEWMGVPHSYDLDLVFGMPLNDSLGFTAEERQLSRRVMTYWTNFAKSGNPNSPVQLPVTWPVFDLHNLSYIALDVEPRLERQDGFRRQQCAFVNKILPMIPKEGIIKESLTSSSDVSSGSIRPNFGGEHSSMSLLLIALLSVIPRTEW